MKRIAKFHKVSKERFTADWIDTFAQSQEEAEKVYEAIRLPKRATAGSAGYDFFAPAEFTLKPGETVKIPTGIRVEMQPEWVLKCYPRSGLGFKYRLQLNNTVGIIDSDYFYSDNEGHIFSKITNDSNENKTLTIPADTGFMQCKYYSSKLPAARYECFFLHRIPSISRYLFCSFIYFIYLRLSGSESVCCQMCCLVLVFYRRNSKITDPVFHFVFRNSSV